jgi:chromosome segregation protein
MVEGFLNTSLSERKEFFDEATGVKQYQIKRDESLNKLLASYENAHQAQLILTEIEPRLRSLTKQVNRLQRRGELESELKDLQIIYYRKLWHEINDKFNQFNTEFLQIEKVKIEKEKRLESLNMKLTELQNSNKTNENYARLQIEQQRLQSQKDILTKQLAKIEAQLEMKLEADGQFDISWLKNKKSELEKELEQIQGELDVFADNLDLEKKQVEALNTEKEDLNRRVRELNNSLIKSSGGVSDKDIVKIIEDLKALYSKLEKAETVKDSDEISIILSEIRSDLVEILEYSNKLTGGEKLESVHEALIALTDARESVNAKQSEKSSQAASLYERTRLIREKKEQLSRELTNIEQKLKQQENKIDFGELGLEQKKILAEMEKLNGELSVVKGELARISASESQERAVLFETQKSVQNLQYELNNANRELSDLKIGATRYETKLEDLEVEIRADFGNLKPVRDIRAEGTILIEPILEKITSIKRQLEQIGGIDPEIEKEFIETKERFDFIDGQINDLDQATSSLEKIIKELDLVIKDKFDKQFRVISEKFEEYFKILFNGGNAKIIKVMDLSEAEPDSGESPQGNTIDTKKEVEENSHLKKIKYLQKYNATGLAGIEIQATPPGKKIKNISMLSGGERALTAIALICAIIHVNPSPFVVLDEVDAALDEANSERLARILEDLSYKTQFIVITHNRASMRRASVLYGVTMGDDGISQLLSVKFDEVKIK